MRSLARLFARRRRRRGLGPEDYLKSVLALGTLGLVLLPLAADATLAATRPAAASGGDCRILRVIDGDTVDLWCAGQGHERARLMGFDTPELFSPSCQAEARAAFAAKWALRRALFQAEELSLVREGTDRFGRGLWRVFIAGEPLAQHMIEQGHARPYGGEAREGWCDV